MFGEGPGRLAKAKVAGSNPVFRFKDKRDLPRMKSCCRTTWTEGITWGQQQDLYGLPPRCAGCESTAASAQSAEIAPAIPSASASEVRKRYAPSAAPPNIIITD